MTVEPADYVKDISAGQDGSQCQLLISKAATPFVIFGIPLLMDYYTVHDDVNGKLGFVPHSTSPKSAPIWGQRPGRVFDEITFVYPEDPIGEQKIDFAPDAPAEKKKEGNAL